MPVRPIMRHAVQALAANQSRAVVEVSLYDDIVHDQIEVDWGLGTNAKSFESDLLSAIGGQDPSALDIVVKLNSYGGDVNNGVAMYNILRQWAAKGAAIRTQVLGAAYSAASVVLMAGDVREVLVGAEAMIHEARFPRIPQAVDAAALDGYAADLRRTNSRIADIYVERAGQAKEAVLAMMAATTWMDSGKATELGFATSSSDLRAVAVPGTPEIMQTVTGRAPSAALAFAGLPAAPGPMGTIVSKVATILGAAPQASRADALATALSASRSECERLERALEAMACELAQHAGAEEALRAEHKRAQAEMLERAASERTAAIDAAVRAFALAHSINNAAEPPPEAGGAGKPVSVRELFRQQTEAALRSH